MQPSTGVNDDLYARALVLSDGRQRIAIITLDYLGFDFAYTETLLAAASKASGIPANCIMLNCSHTHSAPLTAPWGPWKEHRGKPYHKLLPERIAEVVLRATKQLQTAQLRYRREPTQVGFNRRFFNGEKIVMAPNPQGAVLPWVDVLSVERPDGKPIAVLFSHAAHPVIVHEASTLISADYPGFAVQSLKHARDKDTVFLFAQGCCGNINGFPLKGGIDAAAAAGRDLGQAVERALDRMEGENASKSLRVHSSELRLPLQNPPSAKECRSMMEKEKAVDRRQRFAELLAIAESGQTPTMRMPIRAFAIGDLCVLGMAHEPFAEYHRHVNEICPFAQNMVLGYTNGLECYVGTKKDYQLGDQGGYETSPRGAAFMFESRLPLAENCEALIQRALCQTMDALGHNR
ncbi:hypothetical protein [Lignipirellula cremea]|nr:hypothetical protein [Lignipirellula cremea]